MADTIDIEQLLQPVSAALPSGEDLEFDSAMQALESAVEGSPERSIGTTTIAAEDPKWGDIVDRCTDLLARSKDLTVAAKLCRATLALDDLEGLADGLALIDGMLDRFWDTCYPNLVDSDPAPAEMRVNALSELATPAMVTRILDAAWVSAREGNLRVRDVLVAFGRIHAPDSAAAPTESAVRATFASLPPAARVAAAALAVRCDDLLKSIIGRFTAKQKGPQDLYQPSRIEAPLGMLRSIAQLLAPAPAAAAGTDPDPDAAVDSAVAGPGPAGGPIASNGEYRSRQQIADALDRMCDYFTRSEPSSPVPLILQGAKRMLSMTFMELTTSVPNEIYQRFAEILRNDGGAAAPASNDGWS